MFGFEKRANDKESLTDIADAVMEKIPVSAFEEGTDLEIDFVETGSEFVMECSSKKHPELNRNLRVSADRKVLLSRQFKKDAEKMIRAFVDEYLEIEDKQLHEKGVAGQAMSEQETFESVTDSLASKMASLAIESAPDLLIFVKSAPDLPVVAVTRQDPTEVAWVLNLSKEYILDHPGGFDIDTAKYFLNQAKKFLTMRRELEK